MTCPNCAAVSPEDSRYCCVCGAPLVREKKGTHLVPILILIGLTILGLLVYFSTAAPGPAEVPDTPKSDTPWFSCRNGNLMFDKYAYNGPSQLIVPESLNAVWIEDRCFADSDALTEILLPDTVEHIGQFAFADCDNLRALDIPASVITIGIYAFDGCDRLEAVHIPGSVNLIGMGAFDDCPSLSYIFFDGTQADWQDVFGMELPENVTVCCIDGNI